MILRDTVEIVDQAGITLESLPAHVGTTKAARGNASDESLYLVEELRAVLPVREVVADPTGTNADGTRFRWRGALYRAESAAMVRRRAGKDHHMTVILERIL